MAIHSLHTQQSYTNIFFATIGQGFVAILNAIANVAHSLADKTGKVATKRALSKLSNRDLEDIGVSRADIPSVVEEIFKKY